MAAAPPPPEIASRPPAGPEASGPSHRRRSRLARWVRRPALAVALLGIAVAVSVAEGQPPPAARDSGVSVDADRPYRWAVGTLLVVTDGELVRVDTVRRRARPVPLPAGVTALRAWSQGRAIVVLGRLAGGRTVAYALPAGRPPVVLGPAQVAVP